MNYLEQKILLQKLYGVKQIQVEMMQNSFQKIRIIFMFIPKKEVGN